MSATKRIDIDGRTVTVRELTVREVRDWVTEIESGGKTIDVTGEFVFEDCAIDDLVRMSDMPREAFDDLAPSQIEPIREAARALNPCFFRVRAAVAAAQASIAPASVARGIERNALALVTHGHAGVLDYPWRCYLTALEMHKDG